jgi:DNA-binding ferritin-like protein
VCRRGGGSEYTDRLRKRRERAAAVGDQQTADLLKEIADDVDDEQWFIEAMAPARR